jgi:HTH-type transcriptional regulator/antitoxin HipB
MARVPLRTPADVGAIIRARRTALGLGQAELAAKVGVSRLWINQIERGKRGASLGLILRTLRALDVTLTGEAPEPQREDLDAPAITAPDIDAIIRAARTRDDR